MTARSLEVIRSYYIGDTIASIVLSIAGIILLGGGYWLGNSWYYAPTPTERSFRPYITSQAEVLPAIEFRPGLPRLEVSANEFIKLSQGKPYIVSFWSGWINGQSTSGGIVSYSLATTSATGDRYIYATQLIPNYSAVDDAFGYSTTTAYDPTKKEFFLAVTGTHYGATVFAVILLVIGAFCAFMGGGIGFDIWRGVRRHLSR